MASARKPGRTLRHNFVASARYETLVAKTLAKSATTPPPIDSWMKSGIVAAHSIMWETNLDDFKTLPSERKSSEKSCGSDGCVARVLDISTRGGDFEAVKADLGNYFKALSPDAIKSAFGTRIRGRIGPHCQSNSRGVIKKLQDQDKDAASPYITSGWLISWLKLPTIRLFTPRIESRPCMFTLDDLPAIRDWLEKATIEFTGLAKQWTKHRS